MQIVDKLTKGNTYEEYDRIFANANLTDADVNINITQLIDFTICNAGSIMPDEVNSIKQALVELIKSNLSTEYKKIIHAVIQKIYKESSIPNRTDHLFKQLRNITKN